MQEAKRLGCGHGGGSFCLCPKSLHTLSDRTTQLSEAGRSCNERDRAKPTDFIFMSRFTLLPRSRGTQDMGRSPLFLPVIVRLLPAGQPFPSFSSSEFILASELGQLFFFFSYLECSSTISSQAVAFFTVGIQCQIPLDVSLAPVGTVPPLPVMPPWNLFLTYTRAYFL